MTLPRTLLVIVALAFILRLAVFSSLLFNFGETGLELTDSRIFLRTANNLLEGRGFSREPSPPYIPSAFFPPLYPLLVAGSKVVANSAIPLVIFQIVLASLIPVLLFSMGKRFFENEKAALLAAGLAAYEPLTLFLSTVIMSDVVAVFLLLLALYFFLQFLEQKHYKTIAYSALFLALSTLTRPNPQFLFIAAVFFLVFFLLKTKKEARPRWIVIPIFVIAFLVVLSPWLLRNYRVFGTISVATTGARNIYSSLGTSVMTYKTNKPYGLVQDELYQGLAEKYGVTIKTLKEDPAFGSILLREGLKIIIRNPKETAAVLAITVNSFFTQDLYTTYLRQYGLVPRFSMDFSPSVVLLQDGPVTLAKKIYEKLGFYSLIPVAGRAFWIFLTIFWVAGLGYAVKRGGRIRSAALIFTFLILYYAGTSLVAGFSDHGRHRFPANPFIFLLASYGLLSLPLFKKLRPES